ncbi:MAG: CpaD family pilus assembly protein [Pseudomonadota bacterium]
MTMTRYLSGLALTGGILVLSGCASDDITDIDFGIGYNTLSIHNVVAVERPQRLELSVNYDKPELSAQDTALVKAFVSAYRRQGRGPLLIAMPTETVNPSAIVSLSHDISDTAWKAGISYDAIVGTTYGRQADGSMPIILTFQSYEAVATPCPDLSRIDYANTRSNEVRANFGCHIRKNLAQMIVNPADLLGDLEMEPADSVRRVIMLQAFQQGQATGSETSTQENSSLIGLTQQ